MAALPLSFGFCLVHGIILDFLPWRPWSLTCFTWDFTSRLYSNNFPMFSFLCMPLVALASRCCYNSLHLSLPRSVCIWKQRSQSHTYWPSSLSLNYMMKLQESCITFPNWYNISIQHLLDTSHRTLFFFSYHGSYLHFSSFLFLGVYY